VADFTGTYDLGPGAGRVLVKTERTGLAAKVGHDLTIEITRWSARVTVPDGGGDDDGSASDGGGVAAATVTADLDLGSLAVREGTGGAKSLTDRDRRDIQGTASKILGATATASFASTRVTLSAGGGAIEGTLALHGTSRPVRLQVISPAPGRYRGTAQVRQSDFGITPYSGFFGALKLRDEVTVEFEVELGETRNGGTSNDGA
jgi:hypothetical protein